jgi:hypothetical protein
MERLKPNQDKKLPDLNFKLKFFINFSVSTTKKKSMAFATYCGNDDETRSQKLREFVFEDLEVTNQKEFDKLFVDLSNYVKDKIKDKIKEKQNYTGNNWFSKSIENKIDRVLGNEEPSPKTKLKKNIVLTPEAIEKEITKIMSDENKLTDLEMKLRLKELQKELRRQNKLKKEEKNKLENAK